MTALIRLRRYVQHLAWNKQAGLAGLFDVEREEISNVSL